MNFEKGKLLLPKYDNDPLIEEGVLKSCLILDKLRKTKRGTQIISKKVLSLIITGECDNEESICKKLESNNINPDKIKHILNELRSARFIEIHDDKNHCMR